MKEILLTQGKVALVDDEDYERLKAIKWRASRNRSGLWYATTYSRQEKRVYSMHRIVLNANDGQIIDHKDRNGLNNCKSNLRFCTYAQNNANSAVRKGHSVGLKGVRKKHGKYYSYFKYEKRQVHLGRYSTAEEAARVRDAAVLKHFGEFACLNFPESVKDLL